MIHGFEKKEFERRIERATEIISNNELDALFLTTPANFFYFSGFSTQFWQSPTRPWFLIVARSGVITAVIPAIGKPAMDLLPIVNSIYTWDSPKPEDEGISLLTKIFNSMPKKFGRIGVEMGIESTLRMPLVDFMSLKNNLSGYEFVNGSDQIWEIRMTKTEEEVKRIKHICNIVSDAFETLPKIIELGKSERQIYQEFKIDILQRGADTVPYMPVISGQGGYNQIIVGSSDKKLNDGDVLVIDTGSTFDGYFSDFDRNFGIGNVSDKALRANEIVWDATEIGISTAKPGTTVEKVWLEMNKFLEAKGNLGGAVGRMGHGLGLQLTEPPSNKNGDKTVLQPGFILTIEPSMEYERGKIIVHEENLVIRDDDAELLSRRAPREMIRIK